MNAASGLAGGWTAPWWVVGISLVAAVTDLKSGKIHNWLTLPAIVLGLVASLVFGGGAALLSSFAGVVAGFFAYGWIYAVGSMGAGDVKFLMALGAWGGLKFAVETCLLGLLLGGAFAFASLLVKGRIPGFLRRMYHSATTLLVKELEFEAPKLDRKLTMAFGPAIAVAAIWILLADPFVKWGVLQ